MCCSQQGDFLKYILRHRINCFYLNIYFCLFMPTCSGRGRISPVGERWCTCFWLLCAGYLRAAETTGRHRIKFIAERHRPGVCVSWSGASFLLPVYLQSCLFDHPVKSQNHCDFSGVWCFTPCVGLIPFGKKMLPSFGLSCVKFHKHRNASAIFFFVIAPFMTPPPHTRPSFLLLSVFAAAIKQWRWYTSWKR